MNYKLVWSDEFDYEGLPDESKWTYDIGKGQGGWGNGELQKYTDKGNAWVKDGKLTIELRKEQDEFGKDMYTSARIKTKGKADFRYDLDRGTGETGYGPDEPDKHEKQDNVYDNNTDNGR